MNARQKAPAVASDTGLSKTFHSNSSEAQRRRLLNRLRIGPLSTIEARRELDILMPAARVFELRALGYRIDTYRIRQPTECGARHSVARYALQRSEGLPMPPVDGPDEYGRPGEAQRVADAG